MQKSAIKDDVNGNKISLSIYAKSILNQTSEYLEKFFKTNVEAATQEYFLKTAPDKDQFSGVKISDETYEISALRKGDKEKTHEYPNPGAPPPCIDHQLELDTGYSTTVFIDGSNEAAMVGSEYGGAEEITNAGQTTVFVT